MPDANDIQAQQQLLAQYRRTLTVLLGQRASLGKDHAPPSNANGIDEARNNIRQIKMTLRSWSVSVDDLPIDEEAITPTIVPQSRSSNTATQTRGNETGCLNRTNTILGIIASLVTIIAFFGINNLFARQTPISDPTSALPPATQLQSQPTTINAAPLAQNQPTTIPDVPPDKSSLGSFDMNEVVQVKTPDFEVKLISIQILPAGTMQWTFEMWNKTGTPQTVYMAAASYVVDDIGNKYDTVQGMAANIQAGERSEQNITFKAPKAGGNAFSLYVSNSVGVQFQAPAVSFSKVLNSNSVPPATAMPADKNTIVVNQPIQNNVDGFEIKLTTIQILPANVMRWNFDVWNKSGAAQTVYMAAGSYVVDDMGNKNDIIDGMGITFQAGERSQQSITFKAPTSIGKTFSLYVHNSIGVQFSNPAIDINVTRN
jgi:hypothetical protein